MITQIRRKTFLISWKKWMAGRAHLRLHSSEPPLRAELFSIEQLRKHAIGLAKQHRLDLKAGPNHLLQRLADNERVLLEAYELVTEAAAEGRRIAPAGEWLLDNFYLIEQQIRMTRLHLPRTYNRELPQLSSGNSVGLPRVYDIALELIAHVDGRLDEENINHFVSAYQSVSPLNLGELWAIPIMLRLGLIENLRRVSVHIAQRRRDRNLAATWADRLTKATEREPSTILYLLAELAQFNPPFSNQFVEEFMSRLPVQNPSLAIVFSWLQHRLSEQGLTREQLQRADNQSQAADQLSVGNCIGGLRFLSVKDWRKFVESLSLVNETLLRDPAGVYGEMDFATRNSYRHYVELLARRARISEETVASAAIKLAIGASQIEGPTARTAHVGFYLVDKGKAQLENLVRVHQSFPQVLRRFLSRFRLLSYLTAISVITIGTSYLAFVPTSQLNWQAWYIWLLMFVVIIAASQTAVAIVNLLANMLVRPRLLPRLDFSKGIPLANRTMVVIPTLLTNSRAVTDLLEDLEVRYLGNRDANLFFALLTDFRDSLTPSQPDDSDLLRMAREGINTLNERYGKGDATIFYLFHRPRVWNPYERLWMGYERKRGKLEQFNNLMLGGPSGPFVEIIGHAGVFPTIQYVLTLDTDTDLPRDAARKLIGTMAHPLNRPRLDLATGRVVEGYAILQPRTSINLVSTNRSIFARLSTGEAGIDPYTRAVSDIYQDLFEEGSYIGKGIYDLKAFQQATVNRFPENLILSHDLVESGFARSGLVTDVELQEEHPTTFTTEISRRHRWIRGDWQITGWLMPSVRGASNLRMPNTLTGLARWKIFDNLRRSIVPPGLLFMLLTGWLIAPEPVGWWMRFVLILFLFPVFLTASVEALRKPRDRNWNVHLHTVQGSIGRQLADVAFELATMPYRAFINLDAIFDSGVRMLFTRRGLLLWHTERYAQRNGSNTPIQFFREMWFAPTLAAAGIAWLLLTRPAELAFSGPLLFLWLISPVIAWWISRPLRLPKPQLSEAQGTFLRSLARQTWRYFEVLVNEEENWLPPDNFQEVPSPLIATRTSPTNMGMALLANLAATDFGYLSTGQLLDLTGRTLGTMEKLERFRGHFYNWYDTRTLKPLRPQYVSSVDSGNLAGALFTLRAGLWELKNQPIISSHLLTGMQDALGMIDSKSSERLSEKLKAVPLTVSATLSLMQELGTDFAALSDNGELEQQWWRKALIRQCQAALDELRLMVPASTDFDHIPTLQELATLPTGGGPAARRIQQIDQLAQRCFELATMDFSFLYDSSRDLLSIGYNVTNRSRDPSYYDLLASEARLVSFILISQDQLPQKHWFAMGRQLTTQAGKPALLSWSGSMFEYLMPLLIMPTYEHTLLDETYHTVVSRQIEYGAQRNVPWGISESCYNFTDAHGVYQYGPFGVPGLGLKRGLAYDLVIAPYASVLALMIAPVAACQNLQTLTKAGYRGAYGFYEAIDFTPARMSRGKNGVLLRSFMAHHQGMSLLALSYLLLDRPMQRRFLSDPYFKASELLLHERVPKISSGLQPHAAEVSVASKPETAPASTMRVFPTPQTPIPEVHLLSNGRYHVMATNAGGGYSHWKNLAVTRWREDAASDEWGTFCYLRDVATGKLWSSAYQPVRSSTKNYEAIFVQGRAEYRCRQNEIDAHTEIAVSPEDDVEVRRVTLRNLSNQTRTIELTSYAEVVLAPMNADLAHPAFSNLFVQTEILKESQAILCTRRPRSPGEKPPWMFHLVTAQGAPSGEISFETDRLKFIGRCRTITQPAAFDKAGPLSNTEGAVLDPIVAIRRGVIIEPDTSANWHIISGMAETREAALAMIGKYRDSSFAARAFDLAWSHSQLVLRQLQITEAEVQLYGQLASSIIYANSSHRAGSSVLTRNGLGQSGLWAFGISGDLPILLMRVADTNRVDLVKQVLCAHAYWREKGLEADLVILNEDFSGYRQVLHEQILALISAYGAAERIDKPGGIFLRRSEQLKEEDRVLLQTVARVILTDTTETLADQVGRQPQAERKVPLFTPTRPALPISQTTPADRERIFFNGLGGFTPDGREYVITLPRGQVTPAPWANVLANSQIGTVISESGAAYTWVDNAHEFRLTPWQNDPVRDTSGEAFYVRDDETGQFWSPMPLPARGNGTYVCRHGFGYSVFDYTQAGITSELCTYVAIDAPVKFVVVKLHNHSGRNRRLSITSYNELVLGQWRHANLMHVVTETDPQTGAMFAHNVYNREFAGKTVFASVSDGRRTVTGSRMEFIGRNGTLANPRALYYAQLSGKTGAGLDPCAALQVQVELEDGQEHELVFVLGAGNNAEEAQYLVRRFTNPMSARQSLEAVWEFWKRTLGVVYAETPDPALNLLVNGWLEYQTLACRYWGRSGYYQSGGAYGFRDQLQDTAALLHAAPGTAREHLLRCAGRQFREGDVQHWWHPPTGRGVRTHFSDDFLWLPYATCRYVKVTGDTGILDERVPFLEGRPVNADEESYYDLPQQSAESGTLYEHCQRAIQHGLRFGVHGLPLMGCGDWNDGMNLIGEKGKGESVWVAFFLFHVLECFAELARRRGDAALAEDCRRQAQQLQQNIELHGWDGDWYRRAYFDDGTPLGSATNEECQIDSIAQSWAVLSGAGDIARARIAMNHVDKRLVRRDKRLIQLFDPPFDKSALEPGYIKGYLPGIRENGGQYTHAAIWTVMAFTELGDTERAWELFSLLNPIRHATNLSEVNKYKIEPYVVAADIYATSPHTGRGGWSWYTGSAGWMYRLIVETLLGLSLETDKLRLKTQLPAAWDSLKLHYRHRDTFYHITIKRGAEVGMTLDGKAQPDATILLIDDRQDHIVEFKIR